jgi:hypothetical protein
MQRTARRRCSCSDTSWRSPAPSVPVTTSRSTTCAGGRGGGRGAQGRGRALDPRSLRQSGTAVRGGKPPAPPWRTHRRADKLAEPHRGGCRLAQRIKRRGVRGEQAEGEAAGRVAPGSHQIEVGAHVAGPPVAPRAKGAAVLDNAGDEHGWQGTLLRPAAPRRGTAAASTLPGGAPGRGGARVQRLEPRRVLRASALQRGVGVGPRDRVGRVRRKAVPALGGRALVVGSAARRGGRRAARAARGAAAAPGGPATHGDCARGKRGRQGGAERQEQPGRDFVVAPPAARAQDDVAGQPYARHGASRVPLGSGGPWRRARGGRRQRNRDAPFKSASLAPEAA